MLDKKQITELNIWIAMLNFNPSCTKLLSSTKETNSNFPNNLLNVNKQIQDISFKKLLNAAIEIQVGGGEMWTFKQGKKKSAPRHLWLEYIESEWNS